MDIWDVLELFIISLSIFAASIAAMFALIFLLSYFDDYFSKRKDSK